MRIEAGWSLSGICIDWDRCSAFDEFQAHLSSGKPENIDELDKRDRQSLFLMRAQRLASRKDLAVHVSLSSYSIVKQRTGDTFRSETSSAQFFNWVAVCPRNSRETLRNTASQRRRQRGRYMSSSIELSTTIQKNFAFLTRRPETAAKTFAKRFSVRSIRCGKGASRLQDHPVNFGEKFAAESWFPGAGAPFWPP